MRIVLCIDQLNVDAHLIGRSFAGAFENRATPSSFAISADFSAQFFKCWLDVRDHFEVSDFRQAGKNFSLNTIAKILLIARLAKISKGQNSDRFLSW